MAFSSVSFLFYFLPLFFAGYLAASGVTAKNAVLLVGSLMVYAWGEPWFVLVLATQIVFNYAIALDRRDGKSRGSATALGHPD